MRLSRAHCDVGSDARTARGPRAPRGADLSRYLVRACFAFAVLAWGGPVVHAQAGDWFDLVVMAGAQAVAEALDAGADPSAPDAQGWPPLALAAVVNPDPGVVLALIDAGARVNDIVNAENGETQLFLAARSQTNIEVVHALLASGADATVSDAQGTSVLHAALAWFPMRFASDHLVDFVIVHAVSIGGTRLVLEEPLDTLAMAQEVELFLPDLGFAFSTGVATVEADGLALRLEREPPFLPRLTDIAIAFQRFPWPEPTPATSRSSIALLLMDAGADIHGRNTSGMTPLIASAMSGLVDVMERLVAEGADVNARANDGRTALHFAKDGASTRLLLARGASVSARTVHGHIPLHGGYGFWGDDLDRIRALIESGADVDATTGSGRTPLMNAVEYGSPAAIDVLLDLGAAPQGTDAFGASMMDLARRNRLLVDRDTGAVLHPAYWRLNDAQY